MAPGAQPTSQQPSEKSPFLPPTPRHSSEVHDGFAGASLPSAVLSLTTSVVGAGIMGLPATVKTLGLVPGILLILVFGLLADVGVEMMLKFSTAGKVISYAGLMADSFGRSGRILLQSCVLISNFGILVVYLIITGDVLSGSTSSAVHHSGVLEEWAGGSTWWNSRLMVMLFTTVFLLIPLVSFKHVELALVHRAVHFGGILKRQVWVIQTFGFRLRFCCSITSGRFQQLGNTSIKG